VAREKVYLYLCNKCVYSLLLHELFGWTPKWLDQRTWVMGTLNVGWKPIDVKHITMEVSLCISIDIDASRHNAFLPQEIPSSFLTTAVQSSTFPPINSTPKRHMYTLHFLHNMSILHSYLQNLKLKDVAWLLNMSRRAEENTTEIFIFQTVQILKFLQFVHVGQIYMKRDNQIIVIFYLS